MQTKILCCKARPPIEGADVIAEQISAAHRYYNRLVELRRAFRGEADALKRLHVPGLIEAEAAVESADARVAALREEVRQRNALARRKRASPEDQAAITVAREELVGARCERKRLRAEAVAHPGYQSDLAGLVVRYEGVLESPGDTRRKGGLYKEARATCGVYPGTYLRIEAAVEQAAKTARGELRFRRWNGDGLVGPQLTPPLTAKELLAGGDSRLRLELLPSPASGRRSQRVLFWLRVASDGRAPVWAQVPAHLSRGQLPDDALITWATLVRRQVGVRRHRDPVVPEGVYRPYYEWSVQLTIRTGVEKPRGETGTCGVNLGWRTRSDGSLRVGYVVGEDGRNTALELPARLVAKFDHVRGLRRVRDLHFNAMREALGAWLAENPPPDWLRQATETLGAWRSKRRLGRVWGDWSRQRFEGDREIFAELTAWRVKDVHLEQYELMEARRAQRARLSLYRQWTRDLLGKYRVVVVDDTDQRQLARRPAAEDNKTVNETARYNARLASPGLLRGLLVQAGAREIEARDITRACHGCGSIEDWDRETEIIHRCQGCKLVWDQDENAARNLLARAAVVNETPGTARVAEEEGETGDAVTIPTTGGKWARRKAARSRRLSQEAG